MGEGRWAAPSQGKGGGGDDDGFGHDSSLGPAPIFIPECLLGQPDAEPVAVVAAIVAAGGGSVKMGALGQKVKQRLFKPWGNKYRERFGAFCFGCSVSYCGFGVGWGVLGRQPPAHASILPHVQHSCITGQLDFFITERPQYFRFDKPTDTVHLRPGAFPPGAFDEGAAGAAVAADGAGLGDSGGKWCVAWVV